LIVLSRSAKERARWQAELNGIHDHNHQSDNRQTAGWDTSADEIKILNQDISPFEIRSQNFWDDSTQSREE
jgi:hypothetical protein